MTSNPPARRLILASHVLTDGAIRAGVALRVDRGTGRIEAVGAPADLDPGASIERLDLGRRVLVPGGVNSHAHAFQVFLRGRGDDAASFREWVDAHLYPLVESLDDEDLEAAMLLAFAEMARSGTTAVGEFFYIHDRRANALDDLAIRCARRVGLRVVLLRAMYDRGEKPAQRRFHEGVDEAAAGVRALARAWAADPRVTVAPAPHSLHGASAEMIQAAARLADELAAPLHIHLAEQESDLAVARDLYGTTPLRALAKLGALGPRLVAVHGCWLEREELEMLGAAGGGLAYNPSANMFLGDGVTDLETAIRAGVAVSLGCDGPGGNNRVDVFAEMRAAELLQRVSRLRMGVLGRLDPGAPSVPFLLGTRNGARNLGLSPLPAHPERRDGPQGRPGVEGPAGVAAGDFADLVALDPDDLSLAPHHGLETRAFLRNLVYAGEVRSAVREVLVGGEPIVRDGRLIHVAEEEIRERVRRWEAKRRSSG